MKKITFFLITSSGLLFQACLKDNPAVDFSTVGAIVEILPVNGGGLENFDGAKLVFSPGEVKDSAAIVLNIASPHPLNKTLTVTMGVNDGLRTAYNAANTDQYEALPDSVYSFPVKQGTTNAGLHLDTLKVYFFPAKIDPARNYMLPVSIVDAQGQKISGNFGTVYFHLRSS